jgi:3-oxoacyl-[acyl-carrier-protein] synthase-3
MQQVSLIKAKRYLPENIVSNDFFYSDEVDEEKVHLMFQGVKTRRHVSDNETPDYMAKIAIEDLIEDLNLDKHRDIDMLITNTSLPENIFIGYGAMIAKKLAINPKYIYDFHHSGCVSFVTMLHLAKIFIETGQVNNAIICNVQNSAGLIFAQPNTRKRPESRIPGDGCGVAYISAGDQNPILSTVQFAYPDRSEDMYAFSEDGKKSWQVRTGELRLEFDRNKALRVLMAGNKIVPEAMKAACNSADIPMSEIGFLITNQPSNIFLRNWREALNLPEKKHFNTFETLGNLFGAAIPINLSCALEQKAIAPNTKLMFAGFSHGGDFAAAAVIDWRS